MGNKLSPGCCCGCVSLYLGYAPTPSVPLDQAIGTILPTDELRQQSLDRVSLAGHDVVVATGHARNYRLPAGGRWASKIVLPPSGVFCNFLGMVLPSGVDVDIQYIWAPSESTGEDIFGSNSIILHATKSSSDSQFNLSILSDWDDEDYPFGIGPMEFTGRSIQFFRYAGIFKDSVYGYDVSINPYEPDFQTIDGTDLRISSYHRPIKNAIDRRLWIVNNMASDWYFDGLSIWGVNDDRSPDRDATGGCPSVFVENRATIGNEPFLINAEFDGLAAAGTHLSIRRLNDSVVDGMIWTGRSLAVRPSTKIDAVEIDTTPPAPGTVVDEEIWIDTVDPDILYRVEFGPTEVLTLGESGLIETVLCEANLKVYRDGWMPTGVLYGLSPQILFDTMEALFEEVDFEFPFPAWGRGELPMITIEPGPTEGTITANSNDGTSTTWTAPELITSRKFKWSGSEWVAQDEYHTTTLDRVLVISNQSLDAVL